MHGQLSDILCSQRKMCMYMYYFKKKKFLSANIKCIGERDFIVNV